MLDNTKKRPACLMKQLSSLEFVAALLLLPLLLLAVDLEVETSRMPWLQMHASSNSAGQNNFSNNLHMVLIVHMLH